MTLYLYSFLYSLSSNPVSQYSLVGLLDILETVRWPVRPRVWLTFFYTSRTIMVEWVSNRPLQKYYHTGVDGWSESVTGLRWGSSYTDIELRLRSDLFDCPRSDDWRKGCRPFVQKWTSSRYRRCHGFNFLINIKISRFRRLVTLI